MRGDFAGAQDIVHRSVGVESIEGAQLERIIDEFMAIEARRRASQEAAYQAQKEKLEHFRNAGVPKDINDIDEVLTIVLSAFECSTQEQGRALLDDRFVIETIGQAKLLADELESRAQWRRAYRKSYSKLEKIYPEDKAYSEHAAQLLKKADIMAFLQNSPCQTRRQRYEGIDKQMFIKAVDFLDSSYVSIIDYRSMAMEAVENCKLLAEIMNNPYIAPKIGITVSRNESCPAAFGRMLNELELSPSFSTKDELIEVFERALAVNESQTEGMGLAQALLVAQFAEGALSSLDPYTVIYWPSQIDKFEKELTNQFTGIGIKFSKEQESAKVLSVLPDTPAYHCGIEAGDVIEAVDGVAMTRLPAFCVAQSIAGEEGTEVTLTIRHEGENELRDITLQRTRVVIPSVCGWQRNEDSQWRYMIDDDDKLGYIRVSCFDSQTVASFEGALNELEKQGMSGLIIDLRSNPGGLLTGAIEIADKFIREGLIARIQPRCGTPTYISAHREKTHPDYPLVVLIDRFTASSAEILAGVLQEPKHNRATVVGERSYGKSSVQSIVSHLGGGAKLKYTKAYYYLPSGRKIKNRDVSNRRGCEDWGVLPDVIVDLRSDELRKTTNVQRANESAWKNHGNDAAGARRFSTRDAIDADPLLSTAILVLKSKMIKSACSPHSD
jgi:carboxyl-terminal processing protease